MPYLFPLRFPIFSTLLSVLDSTDILLAITNSRLTYPPFIVSTTVLVLSSLEY